MTMTKPLNTIIVRYDDRDGINETATRQMHPCTKLINSTVMSYES
jgi:hypothetical protein